MNKSDTALKRFRFKCLRPDHVDVYDDHVLLSDYNALERALTAKTAECEALRRELEEANERAAGIHEEGRRFLREANSMLRSVNHVLKQPVVASDWNRLQKQVQTMLDQHHGMRIHEDAAMKEDK
jgi:hypothetical protein